MKYYNELISHTTVVKDKIEANRSLFENAAVSRGAILKLFLDEKSALDWLFK